MLRVVVSAPPEVRTPEDLARLPAAADLIELRLDLLAPGRRVEDLKPWIDAAPRLVLATVRSRAQGGAFDEGPAAAAAWLSAAVKAGAGWVDAEADVLPLLAPLPPWVKVVASTHAQRFEVAGTVPAGAHVVKQVGGVEDAADLERFRGALRGPPRGQRAFMPTGPLASLRVLDDGAALLYGSAGAPVVAGQPTLLALLDELRAGEVGPEARLYGLVGDPPAWSPSPALHNAVFRALDRSKVYVPLPGLSLERALRLPFDGLSVTAPHKVAALGLAEAIDDDARVVGAANTLVRTGPSGAWTAFNTDVLAVARSVPPTAAGRASRAVVFGAGGFARAALQGLTRAGYRCGVLARDAAKGRALAAEMGVPWLGMRYVRLPDDGVLVNATPAGAHGEPVPALDTDLKGLWLLDAPYATEGRHPWLTATGAERGGHVVDGLTLLLAQAEAQARLFEGDGEPGSAGIEVDPKLMRVLELALRPRTSLVLVGLRGAGKTTLGRAVARELGRPFVDLDEEVLRLTAHIAAVWIESQGVEAFRAIEARALAGLEGRRGLVVATGGGVLERREHAEKLRALGLVAWLDVTASVAVARLAADPTPRPRLTDAPDLALEMARLKAERDPHYAAAAHERFQADGDPGGLVESLTAAWLRFEQEKRRSKE